MGRTGVIAMAVLSVGVALWSLRFAGAPFGVWFSVDPGIRGVFAQVSLAMIAHTLFAPLALITGPFQFVRGLRASRPRLHRWTGRVYAVCCIVAGCAGFVSALHSTGGTTSALGFGTLAVLWVASTARAWTAALGRNFDLHRRLMRYSFAMTFGAVTLRLQIPIGMIFFHFASYDQMSPWLAYTAWIPNVIAVWLYGLLFDRRPRLAAAKAA